MTAPLVTTARLELYRPHVSDMAGLAAIVQPPAVRRYLGARDGGPADEFARFLRNAGSWALYGYGNFIVRERGGAAVVGICGVFHSWRGFGRGMDDVPEMGWIFAESVWGRGYATEAAGAALDWFDRVHGTRRIACMIDPDNHASHKVAARIGFVVCGTHDLADGSVVLLQRGAD